MAATRAGFAARSAQDDAENSVPGSSGVLVCGNKLYRAPADSGRLWANHHFQSAPLRNVSVGAGFYAAASQATALDNLYFTPALITFDAKLAYEADRWSVALIGKNLADRRYFEPFASGAGTVAWSRP